MFRTIAVLALISSSVAFQPIAHGRGFTALRASSVETQPYFAEVAEPKTMEETVPQEKAPEEAPKTPATKKAPKKAAAPAHKKGIFSPLVMFMKGVLGDEKLNKVRAKAIGMHSDVIANFVDTAETEFGDAVLRSLFNLADKDKDGTICKDELQAALHSLGFKWLEEKQINGIFKRADADGNGAIDMDEWIAEAPKTLRTNLTKLAKKNGGELGFLV